MTYANKNYIFTHFLFFICRYHFFSLSLQAKLKMIMDMKSQELNQMPIASENHGAGNPQQKYFTADEAMAFMEPRIRAMFR